MSEFGALQNCLAVMELANIELKQQNADLVAALEAVTEKMEQEQKLYHEGLPSTEH